MPTQSPDRIGSNESLSPGESISSNNGQILFQFEPDGDLAVYQMPDRYTLWSSGTRGQRAVQLVMQADGNLVLQGPDGEIVWQSNSGGHANAFLWAQDDGNLVIYRDGLTDQRPESSIWSTGTFGFQPQSLSGSTPQGGMAGWMGHVSNASARSLGWGPRRALGALREAMRPDLRLGYDRGVRALGGRLSVAQLTRERGALPGPIRQGFDVAASVHAGAMHAQNARLSVPMGSDLKKAGFYAGLGVKGQSPANKATLVATLTQTHPDVASGVSHAVKANAGASAPAPSATPKATVATAPSTSSAPKATQMQGNSNAAHSGHSTPTMHGEITFGGIGDFFKNVAKAVTGVGLVEKIVKDPKQLLNPLAPLNPMNGPLGDTLSVVGPLLPNGPVHDAFNEATNFLQTGPTESAILAFRDSHPSGDWRKGFDMAAAAHAGVYHDVRNGRLPPPGLGPIQRAGYYMGVGLRDHGQEHKEALTRTMANMHPHLAVGLVHAAQARGSFHGDGDPAPALVTAPAPAHTASLFETIEHIFEVPIHAIEGLGFFAKLKHLLHI